MTMEVVPIRASDLPRVADYLHAHHRGHFTAEEWARSGLATPWNAEPPPNHGFMLLDGDDIAGVIIAMYSKRLVDGLEIDLCNLSSWHVRPDYRLHSFRLLRAALSQDGFQFTDLTPTEEVQRVNLRLGFEYIDTTTALIPNLPWPPFAPGTTITVDRGTIERRLSGRALEIYRDHRHAIPARHVLLSGPNRSCYVMYRRERRKKLPLFASLLYVSDPEAFVSMARPFLRHLLVKHGILATLVDSFIVDYRPRLSIQLRRHRPKMIRAGELEPSKIDALYLYSDLTALPS